MDEILQELAPVMKKEFPRRPPTNENLYSYYMTRVKWNLHVALCFSPVIKSKRNYCNKQCGRRVRPTRYAPARL